VPVATFAIGAAGAANAALFAVALLANEEPGAASAAGGLPRGEQTAAARAMALPPVGGSA
jgi:5-(carboxyamino)imidazole ribonucleotide mutase